MMELHQAISKSNTGKSLGPDGLPEIHYKRLEEVLALPLKILMNKILEDGRIPATWQAANIVLIPKQGTTQESVNNYQPISLLNNDYKLYAGILANRLKKY